MPSKSLLSPAIACILWTGSLSALAAETPVLEIHQNFTSVDVAPYLRVCPPELQRPESSDMRCVAATPESIAAAKQMRSYNQPLWGFLHLRNPSSREQTVVLEHHLAITERISIEDLSTPAAPAKQAGEAVSIKTRDLLSILPAFRFVLKPGETKVLRIAIASDIVTRPGFTLYALEKFFDERQKGNLTHAAFYGLMLSMIFYNLLLFFRLRLRMYLTYVLFILSLTTMYAGLYGHGLAFFWQDWFTWQKYSHSVAKFTAAIFGIAFFSMILNVKNRMPRLFKVTQPVYVLILLSAAVTPLLSPQGVFNVATIVVAIAVVYSLILGILSVAGVLPFSFYYAIAMVSMLTGALINLLQTASLLPSNTFTIHAMQVGTALETIFLSLALGDRYAAIEQANHALQLQRLEDKKRIARDIHDVVGTEFQLRLIEIADAGQTVIGEKVSAGLRGTLNKIREFLFLLHTEENLRSNLEANVLNLIRRLEATGAYRITKEIRIDPEAVDTVAAYHLERAVETTVSNIARHAKATEIRFKLRVTQKRGFLAIQDNGIGFDPAQVVKNIGLESLKYRADRLHGRLRIISGVGRGTTIAIRF